jgi:hypothetical protein
MLKHRRRELTRLNRDRDKKDKSVDKLNDRLDDLNVNERLFDILPAGEKPPQNNDNKDGRLGIDYWRGKWIIPTEIWKQGTSVYGVLKCFPDKFLPEILDLNRFIMHFKFFNTLNSDKYRFDLDSNDPALKAAFASWKKDYLELLEFRRDPEHGQMKCHHCLLSPRWHEFGLFMGIYKVLANSLDIEDAPYRSIYPCNVVNRFKCPYDRTIEREYFITKYNISRKNSTEVDYLFHLSKIANAVETALIKAQELGNDSVIPVNSPQDVYDILTNTKALESILDQGLREDDKLCYLDDELKEREKWKHNNKSTIIDLFKSIKDKININDLIVYPRNAIYMK